jgi:hypothetical protein
MKTLVPMTKKDLQVALLLGAVFCILNSVGYCLLLNSYFHLLNHKTPAVLRTLLYPFVYPGIPGFGLGAMLGGLVQGSVHGAKSFAAMMIFAVPINFIVFAIIAFVAIKLFRFGWVVLQAPFRR